MASTGGEAAGVPGGIRFDLVDVSVRFGEVSALDSVDLTLEPGEAVALVGPSGAGKTTLMRLLNGTVRPDAGSVWVEGRGLAGLSPRDLRRQRARIGFVHQDLHLVPNLRVLRNVLSGGLGRLSLPASLRTMLMPPKARVREVFDLLADVGIEDKIFEYTGRLSGGERQRVAIARALFQRCRALLADEPVSSVDPARAQDTLELLLRICGEQGITLCASLHNLELARRYFPRLIGLRGGRVVFDRPSADIRTEELERLYELRGQNGGDFRAS